MAADPTIPPAVTAAARHAQQTEWVERLPDLVREVRDQWGLWVDVAHPFPGATCSLTLPARLPDGEAAVLKLSMPHPEARGEGFALRTWDGEGAVGLLEQDRDRWALLLEQAVPAQPLGEVRGHLEDRFLLVTETFQKLWVAVPVDCGLSTVADVGAAWADLAEERYRRLAPPFDDGVVRRGIAQLRTLPATAAPGDESIMVHGDLHPGNLVSSTLRGWLAIDPKPVMGDRTYDPWPMLAQLDDPTGEHRPAEVLARRAAFLGDALGMPPERLCAWGLAREVEAALWALDRQGDVPAALNHMSRATMASRAAGL